MDEKVEKRNDFSVELYAQIKDLGRLVETLGFWNYFIDDEGYLEVLNELADLGEIRIIAEKSDDETKMMAYEIAADNIHEEFGYFIGGLEKFLSETCQLGRGMSSNIGLSNIISEIVGLMQLMFDKAKEAKNEFDNELNYRMYNECPRELKDKGLEDHYKFKRGKELTIVNYERAFDEISVFPEWLEENKKLFRIEELSSRLQVHFRLRPEKTKMVSEIKSEVSSNEIEMIEHTVNEPINNSSKTSRIWKGFKAFIQTTYRITIRSFWDSIMNR